MLTKILLLDTIDKVRDFVDIANTKDYKITLKSGDTIVDGKSIISVFSFDLTKPIEMEAECKSGFELSRQIDRFVLK
ncbi:MAG: HPr family phosphocarrier protein [Ruminococcaceae bacterium]|nr:HPr family phosphocarrier protein [Oscillospiraceae bacterium]